MGKSMFWCPKCMAQVFFNVGITQENQCMRSSQEKCCAVTQPQYTGTTCYSSHACAVCSQTSYSFIEPGSHGRRSMLQADSGGTFRQLKRRRVRFICNHGSCNGIYGRGSS